MINFKSKNGLGHLSNPEVGESLLNIQDLPQDILLECLERMVLIRKTEQVIASLVKSGKAKCPCHLSIGQEAVPVGISHSLRKTDRIFGAHRSHGHYLAVQGCERALLAEVLGRATGCSRGMGGSMHIYAQDKGFYGSVPIVAGTVPVAVGAALAAKKDGNGDIAVAYFGDGACEEGVVHECLNMSSVMQLPVLFVVENNLFSSHLDMEFRQPDNQVARFAQANWVRHATIDGNDIATVMKTAADLIETMRTEGGPAFIEAVTYRWNGHVGANDDIDVGVNRSKDLLNLWKQKDPIARLFHSLVHYHGLEDTHLSELESRIELHLESVKESVLQDPYPDPEVLLNYVYK
jgi:TPP-dependent pyruvate/acetoin dehydrogenase alpha subunit